AFAGTAVLRVEQYDRRDRVRICHRVARTVSRQEAVAGRGHDRDVAAPRALRGRRQRLRALRSGDCDRRGAPLRFTEGLPLGLMITGPLWDDLGVLQACRAYEEAAGPAWPSAELTAALAKVEGAAGPEVRAKIRALK